MERARSSDAELEYQISGTGEPVVCIHGAFVADTFLPLSSEPTLARRFRLVLYRRRGYGGSTHSSGSLSIAQHVVDCRALMHSVGLERAHIVGHSYGGAVALQFALDFPDLVQSLALLEPALMAGASAQGYRDTLARSVERYRAAGAVVAVDEFLKARSPRYRAILDRMLPGAFDQAVADAETVFELELPFLADWRFDEADARRVDQPVLSVLGGDSDALWPRFGETHRLLLEWISNAEAFVLPGTTHFMLIEDPGGLADGLAAFWNRHPMSTVNA